MEQAEAALQEGRKSDADKLFTAVREKTKEGLFYQAATQYLAFSQFQAGHREEAYQLLLPIAEHLLGEAKVLLHSLASEQKNWPLVIKLSTECYQLMPTQEIALNNARAFAYRFLGKPAGGWLQTAYVAAPLNVEKVLNEESFQGIKQDPDFQHFVKQLK